MTTVKAGPWERAEHNPMLLRSEPHGPADAMAESGRWQKVASSGGRDSRKPRDPALEFYQKMLCFSINFVSRIAITDACNGDFLNLSVYFFCTRISLRNFADVI